MSMFEIKMPKLGESITEGVILSWSVKVGDSVKEDDVLFEVNTAKVSAEIPSPVAGKVAEIRFKEGDVVPVGTVVALIDTEEETEEKTEPEPQPQISEEKEEAPTAKTTAKAETSGRWYSPIVLQLAKDAGINSEELDSIHGTGYEGRLSKKDIKDYINRKQNGLADKTANAPRSTSAPASAAQEETKQSAPPASAPQQQQTSVAPSVSAGKDDEVREMDRVRRIIADHMVMSKQVSPHVTTVIEADVTNMVQWRERNKDEFYRREGVKLTYMPVIASATAQALRDFPMVNASVDGYNIILHKHINMGIAVSLNDGNLIVPVVRDADKLNINGLAEEIDALAKKARDNKLSADDISGGTFTITNFGTFKSLFGTPIINQPQVAILGVGFIEKKPSIIKTAAGDAIGIRHKMYLSLSYDHRIVDGSLGGMFLKQIADYLENWNSESKL